MIDRRRATVLNAVLATVGWYFSVYCGAHGRDWAGPLLVFLIWLLHREVLFNTAVDRDVDDGLVAVAFGIGLSVDVLLKASGVVDFPHSTSRLYVPPWMTGLWVNMALTLRHSFAFLLSSWVGAAAFGAVVGPAAYWFGTLFDAIAIGTPVWRSLGAIALAWAIALPLLCAAVRWRAATLASEVKTGSQV